MNCAEMKEGDMLVCEDCGLKLQVLEECAECSEEEASCCAGPCTFACCNKELTLQKA